MGFCDFRSDYLEGAHEKILENILKSNAEKTVGYGEDEYCRSAKEKIKRACNAPNADVYFFVGGTQTNLIALASILLPYQGVVCCETAHINCHETGAVEATGHKVISVPQENGKLTACAARRIFEAYENDDSREHTVMPGAIYISHPTELGTLYTKDEIAELKALAKQYDVPLFLDGARLGYGIAAPESELTLSDIAELCDLFYIGGTKCGALFGEALVVTNKSLCKSYFSMMKRHGAVLAKGRLLGIQFDTLFTDNLYTKICKNAVLLALKLKEELLKRGYELYINSPTNQQFFIISNEKYEKLKNAVGFTTWERLSDGSVAIRLVTSFMTTDAQISELLSHF
jgi:threonine aldolase